MALLVVLCVVGAVGLAGMRVFHLKDNSRAEGQAVTPTPVATQPPATPSGIPAGWQKFADSKIGASFIYPNAFGAFVSHDDLLPGFPDYESMLISQVPKNTGIIGVQGGFTLITYKKGHDTIASRKFGPKVKLSGDGWVVVEPNPNNVENYQPGDTYPEMTHVNMNGLDVYTDTSIDQGTVSYSLFFVTNGLLHQLQLPTFDSGAYSSNNINDESAYDAMYQQVRDSVALF